MIAAIIAFLESPLGIALITSAPKLVEEIISILHQTGHVTTAELTAYATSSPSGESLVPALPVPVPVAPNPSAMNVRA